MKKIFWALLLATILYINPFGLSVNFLSLSSTKFNNVGRGVFDLTSPKFQCQNFLKSLDNAENVNIAFLYNTFGNNFDCLKTILSDPRLKTLEVNLINEPCQRNNRCGKYEFLYGKSIKRYDNLLKQHNVHLKNSFESYVSRLQDLLAGYLQPTTQCIINFGLESDVSARAARTLKVWSEDAFPQCQTVWNPLNPPSAGDIKFVNADYVEQHGDTPSVTPPCIVNLDGTDIIDIPGRSNAGISTTNNITYNELQNYIQNYGYCKVVFFWGHEDNGFGTKEVGTWLDPRSRNFAPGNFNKMMGKQIVLAERKDNPYANVSNVWTDQEKESLKGCKKFLSINDGVKKGFVWKQSDAHTGITVLLTKEEQHVHKLELFYNGKSKFSFKPYGIFLEDNYKNRPLWRSIDAEHRKIQDVPFHSVLKDDSGRFCRKLSNPKTRQD